MALQHMPLHPNAIRLVHFLPQSTSEDIHLAMDQYEKYMGVDTAPNQKTLMDNSPKSGVRYTALSYCWGNSNNLKSITMNGHRIEITCNLWQALGSILIFHNLAKHLWIDALCLDQTNIEERNHQVHQMWRIYSDAERVFAWIGLEDASTAKAYRAIQSAMSTCASSGEIPCECTKSMPELSEAAYEITELLDREYFSRTWIKSEFIQARRLELLCGSFRINHLALEHANFNMGGWQDWLPAAYFLLNIRELEGENVAQGFNAAEPDASLLEHLVSDFCASDCSQPQDKIYALLGHPIIRRLDPGMLLKPDYSLPLDELFLVVLEWSVCLGTRLLSRWSSAVTAVFLHNYFNIALQVYLARGEIDRPSADVCRFILSHRDWDISKVPESITLASGRKVDCTGFVLRELLKDWKKP